MLGWLVVGSQTGRLGRNSGIVRCRTGDYKECASLLHTSAGPAEVSSRLQRFSYVLGATVPIYPHG
jgi:hypothetical protein